MTDQIDKVVPRAGRLIRVQNTKKPKFSNAKGEYISIWVEDADSKKERCLLFTERELKIAEVRAIKNPEDLTKKPIIQNLIDQFKLSFRTNYKLGVFCI